MSMPRPLYNGEGKWIRSLTITIDSCCVELDACRHSIPMPTGNFRRGQALKPQTRILVGIAGRLK